MKLTEETVLVGSATFEFQEKLISIMQEYFALLTDDQRVELINRFDDIFCLHCGCQQPKRGCQCQNDE